MLQKWPYYRNYTGSVSKIGIWQGGAMNLKQAKLAFKAAHVQAHGRMRAV
jgi:hypothetical protein